MSCTDVTNCTQDLEETVDSKVGCLEGLLDVDLIEERGCVGVEDAADHG